MVKNKSLDGNHVSSEDAILEFIKTMNKTAEKIGMKSSNFVNPHGLRNVNQKTTAKDMLLMMIKSAGYRELMSMMGRRKFECEIKGENARKVTAKTTIKKSSLDKNYTILASKTGNLNNITSNLGTIADTKNENTSFVGVVLEGRTRYEATRQLFDIGNTFIKRNANILPHELMLKNGNFDLGKKEWNVKNDSLILDYVDYYSYPASFIATSRGKSVQINTEDLNFIPGNKYYVSCMVKCNRYKRGTIGFQFPATSKNTTVGLKRVSDGWEKVSGIFTADEKSSNKRVYFGGIRKANLDGRIDNVTIIDLTKVYGKSNEPIKSEMDKFNYYDLSAEKGIVTKMPSTLVSYNQDNLPVLFEKNSDEHGHPASLTKVLTAIIFLDNFPDLNQKLTIIQDDLTRGSGTKFKAGDRLILRDALYIMMIESSNTIATAFARITGQKLIMKDNHSL